MNESDVFLGVLRALERHNGAPKGSPSLIADLATVQVDTHTTVRLARADVRNLLRNSGQYWQALGLLDGARPEVAVTPLGLQVARGEVTRDEFAVSIVRSMELPNQLLEGAAAIAPWRIAGLSLRPLRLILEVMAECHRTLGPSEGYLTREELVRIVIPLAGSRARLTEYVGVIDDFRAGRTTLPGWPDCAPGANDKRMAGEFLLFLANYGFCTSEGTGATLRCQLALSADEVSAMFGGPAVPALSVASSPGIVAAVRTGGTATPVERHRVLSSVIARPGQTRFRREVLAAYGRCILTGETFEPALQAAHIRPVANGGPDHVSNGLLLRSDVHVLYDASHIRISAAGTLAFSLTLTTTAATAYLGYGPVAWPPFVDLGFVRWREEYT